MTTQQLLDAEQYISHCEIGYFTGPFSESAIRDDLQTRKARDSYSMMGTPPHRTNFLSEKKQFYYKDFNEVEQYLGLILGMLQNTYPAHTLIPRCERCKNQIVKLRNLVQNF